VTILALVVINGAMLNDVFVSLDQVKSRQNYTAPRGTRILDG
jgi:hypothetical protein